MLKASPGIASLRAKAGLTQLELSRRIGVTENTIQNWEKGKVGLEQIERVIKLCEVLDCQLEDLVECVPDTEPAEPEPEKRLTRLRQRLKTDTPAQKNLSKTSLLIKWR